MYIRELVDPVLNASELGLSFGVVTKQQSLEEVSYVSICLLRGVSTQLLFLNLDFFCFVHHLKRECVYFHY